jgi:hypothetical protein
MLVEHQDQITNNLILRLMIKEIKIKCHQHNARANMRLEMTLKS